MNSGTFFQSGIGGGGSASTSFARYSYNTTNGYGSGNTKVRKWSTAAITTDPNNLLTVSNSATTGLIITANVAVRISISYTDIANAAMQFGIVKNGTQGTTQIQSITDADVIARSATDTNNNPDSCAAVDIAAINDFYWCQTDGSAAAAGTSQAGVFIVAEAL